MKHPELESEALEVENEAALWGAKKFMWPQETFCQYQQAFYKISWIYRPLIPYSTRCDPQTWPFTYHPYLKKQTNKQTTLTSLWDVRNELEVVSQSIGRNNSALQTVFVLCCFNDRWHNRIDNSSNDVRKLWTFFQTKKLRCCFALVPLLWAKFDQIFV